MNHSEYIISVNSKWQFTGAICMLFVMSFILLVIYIKRKNTQNINETQKKEIAKIIKDELKDLSRKFLRNCFLHPIQTLKKTYSYIIASYADAMQQKALLGLLITIFISIIFLLLVNSIWEFLYFDARFLTIDSRLSAGEAIELFVGTVLSLLLAVMAWRLDMQLREQDEKAHNREISSQRKRELATNELKAIFIYSIVNNDIDCKLLLKNKNHSTVLPPYLDVVKSEAAAKKYKGDFKPIKTLLQIESSRINAERSNIAFYPEYICISFKRNEIAVSDDFFLAPICFNSISEKMQFFVRLDFQVIDNSIEKNMISPIEINSFHTLTVNSPLRHLQDQTFAFDCEVVSKLYIKMEKRLK